MPTKWERNGSPFFCNSHFARTVFLERPLLGSAGSFYGTPFAGLCPYQELLANLWLSSNVV